MSQAVPNSPMRWIQLLVGPVVWSAHFLVSYLLVEAFCNLGWSFTLLSVPGLSFMLVVITVVAVVITSLFALRSYRAWKKMNVDQSLVDTFRQTSRWSEGSNEFMYFSGFLLSVLFTVAMLLVALPTFFLQSCS